MSVRTGGGRVKYSVDDAREALVEGVGIFWFAACLAGGFGAAWWFWKYMWRAVFG
jgi:hypothetical protein